MKIRIALIALLIPIPALAQSGLDLSWNTCVGGAIATTDTDFECSGPGAVPDQWTSLYLTLAVPQTRASVVSFTAELQGQHELSGPLAPFWHYETGGCQRLSEQGIYVGTGISPSCMEDFFSDPWRGNATTVVDRTLTYWADTPAEGKARMICQVSRAPGSRLEPGGNYLVFTLTFRNANRRSCFGCDQKFAWVWNRAILESDDGAPLLEISGPGMGSDCATINGATAATCVAAPVLNRTWGALKAMYR